MSMEIALARIVLAGIIGFLIGATTKELTKMRLFSMVCMGAALVTYISSQFFIPLSMTWYADPGRLSAQIIVALGFIGSGLIWVSPEKKVEGLATAASLWLTAVIGMALGAGLTSVTEAIILFLVILYLVQKLFAKISKR
ncbi:mg(2+) transport atpase protein c [hydrocarbon metagenome]|uniref:Mg(2+) transport atpase protein c n=1 Tax=hydrocarbon metagenome TaxID=938273 RepID=A0A0W8E2J6_9ZZZZ